ncbi:MAG: radical SAM protein [Candidatus Hydrogenedentes bacterium]|nr:radical SAM protein [Candidatus Hydrogenedentota bacterium]
MSRIWQKGRKFSNLAAANLSSYLFATPAFVRFIPTDRCNLNCAYCWQHDQASEDMRLDVFMDCLNHAVRLRTGLITFLGGEPMLWEPLFDAIAACSQRHILTDMTTNGSCLNSHTLEELGRAGLDYLNISVDGLAASEVSKKDSVVRDDLMTELRRVRAQYGVHFRLNAVIFKNNFEAICNLLEYTHEQRVQISLGFIVPPVNTAQGSSNGIHFNRGDEGLLQTIVDYILEKKRSGYPIIDPDSYFTGVFRFLRGERFWDCNYPTRYGWINVTSTGRVRSCTKAMDELDYRFVDLDRGKIAELRRIYKEKVSACNVHCYSNCAYDSYYYTHHKGEMLKRVLKRVLYSKALPLPANNGGS